MALDQMVEGPMIGAAANLKLAVALRWFVSSV